MKSQLCYTAHRHCNGPTCNNAGKMTPTDHEKSEWSRMAQDAYAKDLNETGHRFSGYASLRRGESISIFAFDALQSEYRLWLNHGFMPA